MELRSFQEPAVAEALAHLYAGRATLLVSPTGAGKTVMAAEIARSFRRPLIVAHRRELVHQAIRTMGSHVRACSVQSVLRNGPRSADLLIIDEAHRSAANTYREII